MKKIPLTQGMFALVDDKDFDRVNNHKWHVCKCKQRYYARSSVIKDGKRIDFNMHRFITKPHYTKLIDHRDENGLNNQRINLRECNNAQNLWNHGKNKTNTSGYKGVRWHKQRNKWVARIQANKVEIHLGVFNCLIKAAKAYDRAAIKYHGEFAHLNFKTCREVAK